MWWWVYLSTLSVECGIRESEDWEEREGLVQSPSLSSAVSLLFNRVPGVSLAAWQLGTG